MIYFFPRFKNLDLSDWQKTQFDSSLSTLFVIFTSCGLKVMSKIFSSKTMHCSNLFSSFYRFYFFFVFFMFCISSENFMNLIIWSHFKYFISYFSSFNSFISSFNCLIFLFDSFFCLFVFLFCLLVLYLFNFFLQSVY